MKKHLIFFQNLKKKLHNQYANKQIVLVGGCFDLLHYGHLQFLKAAKKQGEILIVALESDKFIKINKRPNLVHNQKQRKTILESLKFVDLVISLPYLFTKNDYLSLIKTIKPNIIATSKKDPQEKNKRAQAKLVNSKVIIVTPLLKGFSTSQVLNRLNK